MRFDEAVEKFLIAKEAKGLSPETIANYTIALNQFTDFVGSDYNLTSLDANVFDAYIADARSHLSPSTLQIRLRIICGMLRFCVRRKMLSAVPDFETPKVEHESYRNRAMTVDDLKAMIDLAETRVLEDEDDWLALRNLTMLVCLADFACRAGGLCSLQLPGGVRLNLDTREALLKEKNVPDHEVVFTEETASLLRWWFSVRPTPPKEHGFAFVVRRRNFGPIRVRVLEGALKRLAKDADVEGRYNPHAIRHLWAQMAADKGVPLEAIQHKLGHTSSRMTMLYLNQDKERLRRATDKVASILL